MLKRIVYPPHVLAGIRPALRDHPLPENLRLFGADTETFKGRPHTVQIFDGRESVLVYVTEETVLEEFWEWVRPRCRSGGVNLCYFHNLRFDFAVLFAKFHAEIYDQFSDVSLDLGLDYKKLKAPSRTRLTPGTRDPASAWPGLGVEHIRIKALFGKVNTVRIYQGAYEAIKGKATFRPDVCLEILDSRAFTQASLAKSLKMFGVEGNKLPYPKDLGDKRLRTKEFEAYSKNDAVVERNLAEKILEFHAEYKVRPTLSLSQFSGRVFRRYFFDKGGTIQHPGPDAARAAEISYHAGKNGFYLPGPRVVEDVYEADINSAFPAAMADLPQMVEGEYGEVRRWDPRNVGIYEIEGSVLGGKFPLIFDDAFKPVAGSFAGIWITSYELERVRRSPWITARVVRGHVWKPKRGAKVRNSFREFVDHFYKKKADTPRSDPHYTFYKSILTALYGRFAASVEERTVRHVTAEDDGVLIDDLTGKKVWGDYRADPYTGKLTRILRTHRAGGMTNFFIASLITGRARAMLYDLETSLDALHSATDSVKTLTRPQDAPGLGGHKIEAFGRCYIFRNKLYLHFSKGREFCGHDPLDKPDLAAEGGQHLCKAAFHGFKGKPAILYENRKALMESHHLKYSYTHVVGLREGLRRGETPCDFVPREDEILCLCSGEKTAATCEDAGLDCHCPPARSAARTGGRPAAAWSARVPVTS